MSKILLVEDDETMLSLLKTLLQMEGFQVVQARVERFEDTLETMRAEKPELALIDVNLRQGSGFDLLRMIRSDQDLKNTRILMSSGMDFSSRCKTAGADNFILKPYMPDDLINMIRQIIR